MDISEITRRNILDYLLLREYPFHGRLDLISFLKRIWDLSSMPSTDPRFENAEGDIHQHMINNYDWENDYLLQTYLDLASCNDETFISFVENCVHPIVLKDQIQISETVSAFNRELEPDGLALLPTQEISGRPLFKVGRIAEVTNSTDETNFEIVLSFAGEDRDYVEQVAEYLRTAGVRIFYDKYQESTLWGKDLTEHLDKVYRGHARYCVVFISKAYRDKVYPRHELRSALAKAIEEKTEYILPARFDDTEIAGLRPTITYVDLSSKTPQQLGELIVEKLGKLEIHSDKIKTLKAFRFLLDDANKGAQHYRELLKAYFDPLDRGVAALVQSQTFEDFITRATGVKPQLREFPRDFDFRKEGYSRHCKSDPLVDYERDNAACTEYAIARDDRHLELNEIALRSFILVHNALRAAINN